MSAQVSPFLQQLAVLEASLPAPPPPSYANRLIAQMVLSTLLTLLSLVYLAVSTCDHRKHSKKIALFRLQRMHSGSLLVYNTLYLYVMIIACSGVVLAVYTGEKWAVFFRNRPSGDLLLLGLHSWTCPLLGGWVFTYSVFSSAVRISKTSGQFLGRSATAISNIAFFVVPALSIASTTTLGYLSKRHSTEAMRLVKEIAALLTQGATTVASGNVVDLSLLQALQQRSEALKKAQHVSSQYQYAILGVAMAGVAVYSTITAASTTFVLHLRRQARRHGNGMISSSILVSQDSDASNSSKKTKAGSSSVRASVKQAFSPPNSAGIASSFRRKQVPKAPSSSSQSGDQLQTLASNLSLSVPFTFIESTFFIIMGMLCGTIIPKRQSSYWSAREFQLDAFTWCHASVQICIVTFFLYNFKYNPGRFGRLSSSDKNSGNKQANLAQADGHAGSNESSLHTHMIPLSNLTPTKREFDTVAKPGQAYVASLPAQVSDYERQSSQASFGETYGATWQDKPDC